MAWSVCLLASQNKPLPATLNASNVNHACIEAKLINIRHNTKANNGMKDALTTANPIGHKPARFSNKGKLAMQSTYPTKRTSVASTAK